MRPNIKIVRNGQLLKCYRAGIPIIALAGHFGLSVTRTFEIVDLHANDEVKRDNRLNNRRLKAEFYAAQIVAILE